MTQQDPIDRRIFEADWNAKSTTASKFQKERWQREALGLRLTKSMRLRTFELDLENLPQVVDLTPSPALPRIFRILAIFFFVMTGIPFFGMIGLQAPDMPLWAYLLLAIGPVACATTIIVCTRLIRRRKQVQFGKTGVHVRQRGFGAVREWEQPYETFAGLTTAQEVLDTRYAKLTYSLIILVHPDSTKNVPILISDGDPPPPQRLYSHAVEWGLPILDRQSTDALE